MRFATVVELEETATGVPVRRAEVAWQMTALEARALGALGWGGSLVLRPESTLLRALVDRASGRFSATVGVSVLILRLMAHACSV